MTDTLSLTTADLSSLFRPLLPLELLDAVLVRTEPVQPELNPFCLLDPDQARQTARASERRCAEPRPLSGLVGITVAIKDNQAVPCAVLEQAMPFPCARQ